MTKLELVEEAVAKNEEIIYAVGPKVYGVLWPGFSKHATEALKRALQEMENEVHKATDSLARFGEAYESLADLAEEQYRKVATNRQWYLYKCGKPRIRKKWESAFCRKIELQFKRGKID